jgi:hypothetical protein
MMSRYPKKIATCAASGLSIWVFGDGPNPLAIISVKEPEQGASMMYLQSLLSQLELNEWDWTVGEDKG